MKRTIELDTVDLADRLIDIRNKVACADSAVKGFRDGIDDHALSGLRDLLFEVEESLVAISKEVHPEAALAEIETVQS
jgi:hypothetical protein